MASLNLIDVLMVGQLGDQAVAGVGLANQVSFILMLMLFGISSGSAVFTAQYWGRRDIANIHKVLGICIGFCLLAGSLFTFVTITFPSGVMGILSPDPVVISIGSRYLALVSLGYLPYSLTSSYVSALRSTHYVKVPMTANMLALGLKTLMNYTLIFGNFGFPALGVEGAGVSTFIARVIECAVLLFLAYHLKTPAAARPRQMIGASWPFVKVFLMTSLPVALNETLWSVGMTIYNMIYARISTQFVAAVNIATNIENMAFVFFVGFVDASAILIGNQIGSEKEEKAFTYARRSLSINLVMGVILGLMIYLGSGVILSLFRISADTQAYARYVLTIISCVLWAKSSNFMALVGIMRSGGDTRYALLLEIGTLWLVGIPLVTFGAFVLHLPLHYLYLIMFVEELIKFGFAVSRFISRRWIHNLAHVTSA